MRLVRAIGRKLKHSHATKLALSLSMLVLSMLFVADLLALRGDPVSERQKARNIVVESLAVQLTTLLGGGGEQSVRHAILEFVNRNDDVLAAVLVRESGRVVAEHGDTKPLLNSDYKSVVSKVVVPIFDDRSTWGSVRVSYKPLKSVTSDVWYFSFLVGGSLLLFQVFLSRALIQLDPSRAVPVRVNSAFNLFTEGVIILDSNLQIMLSNQAAAQMVGAAPEQLLGKRLNDWPWESTELDTGKELQLPWETAFNTGIGIKDQHLYLNHGNDKRSTRVSCTLVGEEDPSRTGVMVTINDISELEKKSREQGVLLKELKSQKALITQKNLELEALASLDPLTGLLNRRKFLEKFSSALEVAVSSSTPLSCIMLDIDFFKAINDNYGHAVGDEVIRSVARVLKEEVRQVDIVGRYGGEEFVVVMPNQGIQQSVEMGETLRLSVQNLAQIKDFPVPKISVSLGVSELLSEAAKNDTDSILERADKALYSAKGAGRNRVVADGADTLILSDASEELIVPLTGAVNEQSSPESDLTPDSSADDQQCTSNVPLAPAEVVGLPLSANARADVDSADETSVLKTHDLMTLLPKRQFFMEAVENALVRAEKMNFSVGILSMEIKEMSHLVSSLGYQQCEALVARVINRIQEELRASDVITLINESHSISHLAENDYGILLSALSGADQALPTVARIQNLLREPLVIAGEYVYLGFNIGIALYPQCGHKSLELLEAAIGARAIAARQSDIVSYHFATDIEEISREYRQLESDLYQAVAVKVQEVYFQPKFDLATRTIKSVEALVRWRHSTRGVVSPSDFIPIAEANGLVREIFNQVLETSLQQLNEWDIKEVEPVSVSVNLSGSQLRDANLVSGILAALQKAEISPKRLEIELTETSIIQSAQQAKVILGQLREAGIVVTMDDFGTGYTSLGLLAELPLDSVKIDRTFISAMQSSERSRAIVESVINMAHTLRLIVVAEGVETNEQLTTLDALGCDEVQGYLISRPLPGSELITLLKRNGLHRKNRRAS